VLGRLQQLGLTICFTAPGELEEGAATDCANQPAAVAGTAAETINPDMMFARYAYCITFISTGRFGRFPVDILHYTYLLAYLLTFLLTFYLQLYFYCDVGLFLRAGDD